MLQRNTIHCGDTFNLLKEVEDVSVDLIVCKRHQRDFIGFEIEPSFVKAGNKRLRECYNDSDSPL